MKIRKNRLIGPTVGDLGGLSRYGVETVTAAPTIATVAGNGTRGSTGDGGPATSAELNSPSGVVLDSAGNLYIADTLNQVIRKVDTSGNIHTVAGNGTSGYSGDGGPATSAELNSPSGVALDSAGNLYIADTVNNVIRKVDTSGNIHKVAGNHTFGYRGDGDPASTAELFFPYGVALDSAGNLYIADYYNNVIRKVDARGDIHTVAGLAGQFGYSGDGGPATSAEIGVPLAVALDGAGNLYIADTFNDVIRKMDTSGNIHTVAGDGTSGYSGDSGPAASAQLSNALGVALDSAGDLYIADTNNNVIRKVNNAPPILAR